MAQSDIIARLGFWGVRGSTPTVDRANWRYGGNTPCLELITPEGTHFILDCGTGLRMLGNKRVQQYGSKAMSAHVFVTHYHWDHIQGIPFFAPLYSEQNSLHFYSFRSEALGRNSLQRVLDAQMATPYFPVDVSAMAARRQYTEIEGGDSFEINGARVTTRWLNHPQGCLGFRFETAAGTVVYATDNEPGNKALDKSLRELAAGADILVNDAQYTREQLQGARKGWGHSSWQDGVDLAREVGVRNLVLFHHDPESTDRIVDARLREARQQFESVWAAAEGMVMSLCDGAVSVTLRNSRTGLRRDAQFAATVSGVGRDGKPFTEETLVHDLSLNGASFTLSHMPQLQGEVEMVLRTPGKGGGSGEMRFRGHIIHRDPVGANGPVSVGIIFSDDPE